MKLKIITLRIIIVWLITGISLIVPNFTDFLNIAGSIGSAMIAFILPPLLYLSQFRETVTLKTKLFNYFIMLFGAAGAIYSTYFSIDNIIHR